jgi:hypothetical protein
MIIVLIILIIIIIIIIIILGKQKYTCYLLYVPIDILKALKFL